MGHKLWHSRHMMVTSASFINDATINGLYGQRRQAEKAATKRVFLTANKVSQWWA